MGTYRTYKFKVREEEDTKKLLDLLDFILKDNDDLIKVVEWLIILDTLGIGAKIIVLYVINLLKK